jgi:hypothetical protein
MQLEVLQIYLCDPRKGFRPSGWDVKLFKIPFTYSQLLSNTIITTLRANETREDFFWRGKAQTLSKHKVTDSPLTRKGRMSHVDVWDVESLFIPDDSLYLFAHVSRKGSGRI